MSNFEQIQVLKKKVAVLSTLNEIGKSFTTTLDFSTLLKLVIKKINALFRASSSSLFLIDSTQKEVYCKIATGKHSKEIKNFRFKVGEGALGEVARTGKVSILNNITRNKNAITDIYKCFPNYINSIVCVPLKTKDRILGIIALADCPEEMLHPEDIFLLSASAEYSAIAIENAMYVEQIQDLIITDECTSLYNIRHFNNMIEKELARSRRYNHTLSLVLFDLDHFKKVNDKYGHICGSFLLKEIGFLIKQNIRGVDSAYRYGGDEFLLLLPQTSKKGAFHVAERFCHLFSRTSIKLKEAVHVTITASFGVTSFPEDGKDSNELLFLADQVIYQIKQRTRNKVGFA